jgi:MFS family permease
VFKNNRNLLIIALIAVVNALGYGIIIPVLYSYSLKFGLTDFQNGLLFAIFSAGQFLSTPIIGRLSDRYGRKPLLVASLAGTALSFFMMAFAPNAIFLFLARALDGITAGNIPVASAVISDTTDLKNRARGFGLIGASFGFGFVFGPAISALTVGISDILPFIIAGVISLIAVIITAIYLPETNKHIGQVSHEKLFDLKKLFKAVIDENIGTTLLITLIYFTAFGMFIFAFQPFSIKILKLSANQISILFTVFGIIGLITQTLLIGRITKLWGVKRAFNIMLFCASLGFLGFFFTNSLLVFLLPTIVLGFSNSSVGPLIQTILSKETDERSQGMIQGLNASYMSIGFIVGPIVGGALATFAIPYPFLAGSALIFICFLLSFTVLKGKLKGGI